jgi:glycolate oxidase iron-sulfur subunit
MAPNINAATARVLDALGVQLMVAPKAGCCGALRHHLNEQEAALDDMRRNIDAWWPYVQQGGQAIVMTASGCGATVKEYGHLLAHDSAMRKAQRISALTRDLSEVMPQFEPNWRCVGRQNGPVAYHPPCTLQHGQQIRGKVEACCAPSGSMWCCADSHLCCGSAGSYSLLQPELSLQLRDRKLASLADTGAQTIVSANVGCTRICNQARKRPSCTG